MYLNAVYFGHHFYRIAAASRGYFARRPAGLTWSQATLLAGLPQAPSALDPLRHQARARARQREVLDQLVETGVMDVQTALHVAAQPEPLTVARVVAGVATVGVLGALVLAAGEHRATITRHAQSRVDDVRDLSRGRRAQVPVAVLNGSSVAGLALATQRRLVALGFARDVVANAAQSTHAVASVAYADQDATGPARAIARLLGAGAPTRADATQRAVTHRAEVIVTLGGAPLR